MNAMRKTADRRLINGFTLIELVVVIVIIGVLSSFAVPRFFNTQTFSERGYFEELAAALRFAQKTAVATGCPVRAVVVSTGYSVTQQAAQAGRCNRSDTSWSTAVALADGSFLTATTPIGVSVTPDVTLVFDTLGVTSLGADATINVGAHSLTIQAASGYIDAP